MKRADEASATFGRWVRVCELDELDERSGRRVPTIPPIVLFRQGDDVFCLEDNCSHETFPLSGGLVERCSVECPLHGAVFDLRTGTALSLPATMPVRTYEVRIEPDGVHVFLPADVIAPR